jgi:uncharacterized protein YbjT (DUF2867 family)
VIDTATGPSPEEHAATDFFVAAASNLQASAQRSAVRRIVVVSIIGTDCYHGGYGRAKVAHEKAGREGPVPTRIVRAAQFHEFVGQLLDWSTQGDTAYLPEMRTQLVAARTVAETLVEVATQPDWSTDEIVEIAGPREERLGDMARLLAAKRGTPAQVVVRRNPDDPDDDLYATGGLLPSESAWLAGPTFEQWLDSQP